MLLPHGATYNFFSRCPISVTLKNKKQSKSDKEKCTFYLFGRKIKMEKHLRSRKASTATRMNP
jgi:hypothetical protein